MRKSRRFLVLICNINLVTYTIVNVYAPNAHQIRFFHKLMRKVHAHKRGLFVLCGDFNISPDPTIDTTSAAKHMSPPLQAALHKQELFHVWRCFHAGERDFTFFWSPHHVYTRIDLFLVDLALSRTIWSSINSITWSDHSSITLTMSDSSSTNSILMFYGMHIKRM